MIGITQQKTGNYNNTFKQIEQLAHKIFQGGRIDRDEALYLLHLEGAQRYDLFYWANQVRSRYLGDEVSMCAIASLKTGNCSEDCRFCAQSARYNSNIKPISASRTHLIEAAATAKRNGAQHFGLVSSGRGPTDRQIREIAETVQEIKDKIPCCAALGCLTPQQARMLHECGVHRYNHNLETSRRFFPFVTSSHTYDDRISTVRAAQNAGMQVCCGGIIGLGETLEDRVELAFQLRDLDVDTVPLNFLNPIAGTPFEHNKPIKALAALQAVAMFRFVLPEKHIKVAGGREACLRDLQSWIFFAGASSMMIGHYLTTKGRAATNDWQMLQDLEMPGGDRNKS